MARYREFMIELGDAVVAELFMRRSQLPKRIEEFSVAHATGSWLPHWRFDLDEQRNVVKEDERVRKLRRFPFPARVPVPCRRRSGSSSTSRPRREMRRSYPRLAILRSRRAAPQRRRPG